MTFNQYCSRHFVPFDVMPAFRHWLGSVANSNLPKNQWHELWMQFVAEVVGGTNNGTS